MLTVIFNAKYDKGSISVSDDEIIEAKWFTEAPKNVADFIREKVEDWENDN